MVDHERVAEIARCNKRSALCIVTSTSGSTPQKAGARMLVHADGTQFGEIEGSVGGGAIEHKIRLEALAVIQEGVPRQTQVALTHELGMCCGGQMTIYIEPLRIKPPLLVLGAGHIGQALTRLATQAGFDVTVADPRPELRLPDRLAFASRVFCDYSGYELDQMPFHPDTYVVVVTHDHQIDQRLVEEVLNRPFRYLALVASKRKAKLTKERCLAKGFSTQLVSRICSPAGLDIFALAPEEIAISIVAQMIQVRRNENSSAHRSSRPKLSHEEAQSTS